MPWYLLLQLLWKTPPYGQKTLLKSKKNIFQISHLIFGNCRQPNIWFMTLLSLSSSSSSHPSLTGPFSIYLEYLDAKKMMDKVDISVWNIWMWRKWETKFRNPKWHSSHCSCCIVQWQSSSLRTMTSRLYLEILTKHWPQKF